jgi:hypothetical protein
MYETTKFDASFDGVVVDLRSDTLTLPTLEMRQAMFDAVVGDDVFGEDPTIIGKRRLHVRLLKRKIAFANNLMPLISLYGSFTRPISLADFALS